MGKSLEITPKNIEHIRVDVLTKQYQAITQQLHRKVDVFAYHELGESFVRLRKEAQLIQTFLKNRDLDHLIAEQMTFPGMERPRRPTYVSTVEYKLFEHYQNLKRIEELQNNLEKGVEIVIPMATRLSAYLHSDVPDLQSIEIDDLRFSIDKEVMISEFKTLGFHITLSEIKEGRYKAS
ncbi:hypothetical protein P9597_22805 [Aneurinibacillus migulanus]|uniref:hypothetical protein n=1 Tax=Aneurinibacillus migulanus TaxID=47500 RepID=UPI002E210805|nr:hypothetical protein [Aneurinibacillus migulanus]